MAKSIFDIIEEVFGVVEHAVEVDAAIDFLGDHMEKVVSSVGQGKAELKKKCEGCKSEAECLPKNLARIDDQAAAAKKILEGFKAYKEAIKGGKPIHGTGENNSAGNRQG